MATWPDARGRSPDESRGKNGPASEGGEAPPSDMEVIQRVLRGENRAFELLIERHKGMVAAIVGSKVPRDQAPEVAHEVFVRAFESLAGYRPLKPFANWLATLAVRSCYDFWREHYRQREVSLTALSPEQQGWLEGQVALEGENRFANDQRRFETWEMLDWALGQLSAEDRMAVTLLHLEGCSVAEAAELLGWSQVNVKVRAFRARRRLKTIIVQAMGEENP